MFVIVSCIRHAHALNSVLNLVCIMPRTTAIVVFVWKTNSCNITSYAFVTLVYVCVYIYIIIVVG